MVDMVAKPIVQDSDPILRTISEEVTAFDGNLRQLVTDMQVSMRAHNGRGLSAIQIGVPKRVIMFTADDRFVTMVNPVLVRALKRDSVEHEGCLSIPRDKWRLVSRPAKCEVSYFDIHGVAHTESLSGDSARVFQHEFDHLNGILITDKPAVKSAR